MLKEESKQKYKLASQLYQQKKFLQALPILDELEIAHPSNGNIIYARALCLLAMDMKEEAQELCIHLRVILNDPRGNQLNAILKESKPETIVEAPTAKGGRWRIVAGAGVAILVMVGGVTTAIILSQPEPVATTAEIAPIPITQGPPGRLRVLALGGNPLDDADLRDLRDFEALQVLGLENTAVTDSGMDNISNLPSLIEVRIAGTQVTEGAASRLQRALPSTRIVR